MNANSLYSPISFHYRGHYYFSLLKPDPRHCRVLETLPTSSLLFQVLGYIAKGSFGPILKVKDKAKQKTYAVKIGPTCSVVRVHITLRLTCDLCPQRQVRHPFVHDLQDCWQTQRHLYIMCDYCSTGDLYTYWVMIGQFSEDAVRVFAAELGCALGFLHDVGIIHRDVKVRARKDMTSELFHSPTN
ncbi:unnamed protein product [Oncorhynchus mykiss]|uniref:Protein kinase domain-containing protein n=1 Tax=Oncorhynchus mykiss TaxID=8022 RepID=A0A060Y1E7_ONCMY|nr:unnamed protein product [Oncorhynchus mykiss]